jgi:short-subunit dehydrogenase
MNLILGGTHGLGREIALALKAEGEETFVIGRTYSEASDGLGAVLDLSDTEAVEAFIETLTHKTIVGFYWVSGYGYNGDFAKQPTPKQMINVNFANVVPLAQIIWKKQLKSDKPTHFVVISSTTGTKARADEAVYAAAKHAQVGFARSLGLESERLKIKIKVALFLPGGMRTPFWDGNTPDGYENFLDPKKVAARVVSRARDQADYFLEDRIERGSL